MSVAQAVYKQVSNSIFTIFGIEPEGKDKGVALGSAVAIDKNILATNCHVALAGTYLVVYINDTPKRGELYYYDRPNDLCLVKVSGVTFIPVNMRQTNTVNIGEEVFAIGNPKGFEKTISQGIISNKHKFKNTIILQTDASVSPGSSGGGLFDQDGNLIGITSIKDVEPGATDISFAIPTELITAAMQQEQPAMQTTSEPKPTSSTELKKDSQDPNKSEITNVTRIAYYGNSHIGLMKWKEKCFITIPGKYNTDQTTSLAIWFPETPEGMFIFSKMTNADDAIKFLNKVNQTNETDVGYPLSKSYIFFNKKLSASSLIVIKKMNYPVYIFASENDLSEKLMVEDYFLGQFYGYNGEPGMTTIKFGLDGFTEALGAYNQSCNKNRKN